MSRAKKVGFVFLTLVIVISPPILWLLRPPKAQKVTSIEELFPGVTAPEEAPGEETFSSIRGEYTNNSVYVDSVRYDKHYLIPSRITDTETAVRCKLYKSNLETLLGFYDLGDRLYGDYRSWKEQEQLVNRPVDPEKLSLVSEWEERSEEGKPWVLVSLPLDKVGIYYLKLEHPDLLQPYGVHIVINRYFLTTQLGATGGVIWALDMAEVKDQPGVELSFYDVEGGIKKIREGVTNEEGLFVIPSLKPYSEVDLVVGRYKDDTFLASFNFAETAEFRAHLETDLPLYRPGDTVRFSGIVWREEAGSFSSVGEKSGTSRLKCGWGSSAVSDEKTIAVKESVFDTSFALENDFSGWCNLSLILDGEEVASTYIDVGEYVKPTFEVKALAYQKEYFPEETVKFEVEAKHFSGVPIKGKLKWEIYVQNFSETERSPDYDPYDLSSSCGGWWGEEPASSGQEDLDGSGKATVSYKPGMMWVRESAAVYLTAKVVDLAEESHTSCAGAVVHQGDFKLLVRHADPYGYHYLPAEGGEVNVPIKIKSLNHQDKSISVSGITGGIYLLQEDDEGNVISRQLKGAISVDTGQTGEVRVDYLAKEEGSYEVEVTAPDSKGRLIRGMETFSVYRIEREEEEPWPGYKRFYPGGWIEVRFDEETKWRGEYEVGETAKTSFYKGDTEEKLEGRGLVAIQTKSRFTYEFRDLGEVLQIPVGQEHVPSFEISVFMVDEEKMIWQGGKGADVTDPQEKMLPVEITPNKSTYGVREEAQVSLQLRNYKGEKVAGQILLSVTDKAVWSYVEELPDNHPYSTFYDYFNTSILSSHSLEQSLTFFGGGGAAGGGEEPERVEFLDTAYWNPWITTDAGGTAKVAFALPDNLTTWYLYAIGLTKNAQVGSEVGEIKVYQAVFLDPRLLPSYQVGEEAEIKGTLHNFTEKSRQFTVKLEGQGFAVLEGGTQSFEVGTSDTIGISWKVRIGDVSEAIFKFSATDGEVGDSLQLKRPVRSPE